MEVTFEEFTIILSDAPSNTSEENDDVFSEGTTGESEEIIEEFERTFE